jgi:hypothetical protein
MEFDEWVKFVFDHPVQDDIRSAWYYDEDLDEFWDEWDERSHPEKQLEYATRLFQNPTPPFYLQPIAPSKSTKAFGSS